MHRYLLVAATALLFTSCAEVAKQVGEELKKSEAAADSLAEAEENETDEFTERTNDYKLLQRKKEGEDSLFLVGVYYRNKKKKADIWYRWNKQDGPTTFYHTNGQVFYKLTWKNGLINSVLGVYDTLGKPLESGNLKDGDGLMKYYNPGTCKVASEIRYINGVKNGNYLTYFKSGGVKEKGSYKNGKPEGQFTAYFKSGKLKERGIFVDGQWEGEHYIYYSSEKPQLYEKWHNKILEKSSEYDARGNMTRNGTFSEEEGFTETRYDYSPEGKMRSRCRYHNGMKNGLFEYYEGNYRRSLEIWQNDTLLREWAWHSNEKLKSVAVYHNNQRDSIYTEYYSTGKLRLQEGYKNGMRNGIYISYFDNGNKYVEGAYKDGYAVGKFRHYHKDGTYNGYYTVRDRAEPPNK